MSKIDQLISELCKSGVEYKSLGDVCDIKTGLGITISDAEEGAKYPIISGGVKPMGYYYKYNRDENTLTIARAGSAGYVNYIKSKFWLNDKCFSIIPNKNHNVVVNSKFLYFYLKHIEEQIMYLKSAGSVPTVNTQKISSIEIPIPPI